MTFLLAYCLGLNKKPTEIVKDVKTFSMQGAREAKHMLWIYDFTEIAKGMLRFQRYDPVLSVFPKRCHKKTENRNVGCA